MQSKRVIQALFAALIVAISAAAILDTAGCSRSKGGKRVSLIGSTSLQPFVEMLAEEFNAGQSEIYVEVQGGGTTAGLQAVDDGIADIGMCSRGLKPEEKYTSFDIAYDGIAVVVNNQNHVSGLTRSEIADMFVGKITDWSKVGQGGRGPVRLITREEGSGTREAFTKLVMEAAFDDGLKKLKKPYKDPATMPADIREKIQRYEAAKPRISLYAITEPSNGSVKALVTGDPAAIGYMSLGQVGKEVRALTVDGVVPSAATVHNKSYPLVRPFLFIVKDKPTAEAQKFIDYVYSKPAQDMLEKKGLVRRSDDTEATSHAAK